MDKKLFYNSKEVKSMLGLGCIRTAQIRIKAMNDELKAKGYWVERGKVPVSFFHEKYPYVELEGGKSA
ncbi:hypothetical protein ACQVTS_21510 [Bacillus mycoides]|uniref:hypothetical protein n=1 Tax=Bacillus mycoides TaxID=1405 RepID=UPI003D65DFE0